MAFFDDLGRKISDVTDKAGQMAGDASGMAKLKMQISSEQDKIKKAYAALGEKYYSLHSGDAEAELSEIVSAINESMRIIESSNSQIEALKADMSTTKEPIPAPRQAMRAPAAVGSGVRCTGCGRMIPTGSKFCMGCGTPAPAAPVGRTCKNCGSVIPDGSKFCMSCGTPAPAEGTAPAAKICTKCGSVIPDGSRFCMSCGTPATVEAAPVEAAVEAPAPAEAEVQYNDISEENIAGSEAPDFNAENSLPEGNFEEASTSVEAAPAAKICVTCGSVIPDGSRFCMTCGTPAPEAE